MKKKISFYSGLIMVALVVAMGLLSLVYTPYDGEMADKTARFVKPCLKHIFGTDRLGRDVFSRCLVGAKTTFFVSISIVFIGAVFGTLIGAITGFFGGLVDEVLMRINDGVASFPSILLALIFVSIFGSNTRSVIIVLGILFIPSFARVVRSEYIRERNKDYVKSMKLYGAGNFRLMFGHILPNILPSLAAAVAIGINNAILAEASLSYLGLGVQPPTPSLGRMVSEGQMFIFSAPWISLFPGLVIVIIVLGFSMVSNYLEEGYGHSIKDIKLSVRRAYRDKVISGLEALTDKKETDASAYKASDRILDIKSLSVAVPEGEGLKEVVHNLSFTLDKGQILGIVGESGSGKSISMAAIMGLLGNRGEAVISGTINGKEFSKLDETDKRILRGKHITQVFQEPLASLNPTKKVGQILSEILKNHPEVREYPDYKGFSDEIIIKNALSQAGIEEVDRIYDSYPHQLSGGLRQRALIALCIISRPELLILDEPTTAIDKAVADKLLIKLKELHDKYGMAMILISHDLAVAYSLCQDVIVMKNGQAVERGTISEVLNKPSQGYTKELIASASVVNHVDKDKVLGEPVLTVKNLNVTYKRQRLFRKPIYFQAVKDFSLELKANETLGICGPSGCGKTTILKAITNSLPYSGEIKTDKRIAMVFQDPYSSLNRKKKVGSLLAEVYKLSRPSGVDDKMEVAAKVKEALVDTGLSLDYISRYPSELSGGERQRVSIAMALISNPEIVLLDEPVTALDATIQAKILELLAKLSKDKKLSYIIISHNPEVIGAMCDRVIEL